MRNKLLRGIAGTFLAFCMVLSLLSGFSFQGKTVEAADVEYAAYMKVTDQYHAIKLVLDKTLAPGDYILEMDYYVVAMGNQFGVRLGDSAAPTINSVPSLNEWHTYSKSVTSTAASNEFNVFAWPTFEGYFKNIRVEDTNGNIVAKAELKENTVVDVKASGNGNANTHALKEAPIAEKEYVAHVTTSGGYHAVKFILDSSVPAGTYTLEADYYIVTMGNQFGARIGGQVPTAITSIPATNEWHTSVQEVTTTSADIEFSMFVWPEFDGYFKNLCVRNADGDVVADVDMTSVTTIERKEGASSSYSHEIVEWTLGGNDDEEEEEETDSKLLYLENTSSDYDCWYVDLGMELSASTTYKVTFDYYVSEFEAVGYSTFQTRFGGAMLNVFSGSATTGEWLAYTGEGTTSEATNRLEFFLWPSAKLYVKNIKVLAADGTELKAIVMSESIITEGNGAGTGSFAVVDALPGEGGNDEEEETDSKLLYLENTSSDYDCWYVDLGMELSASTTYKVTFDYYVSEFEAVGYSTFNVRYGGVSVNVFSGSTTTGEWLAYTGEGTTSEATNRLEFFMWPSAKLYVKNIKILAADGTELKAIAMSESIITEGNGEGTGSFAVVDSIPDGDGDEEEEEEPLEDKLLYIENISEDYDCWYVNLGMELSKNTSYKISFEYYVSYFEKVGYSTFNARFGGVSSYIYSGSATTDKWISFTAEGTTSEATNRVEFFLWPEAKIYVRNIKVLAEDGTLLKESKIAASTVYEGQGAGVGSYELVDEISTDEDDNSENENIETHMLYLENVSSDYTCWSVRLGKQLKSNKKYTVVFKYYVSYFEQIGYSTLNIRFGGHSDAIGNPYSGSATMGKWIKYQGTATTVSSTTQLDIYLWPKAELYIEDIQILDEDGNYYTKGLIAEGYISERYGAGTGSYDIVDKITVKKEKETPLVKEKGANRALYLENTSDGYYSWAIKLTNQLLYDKEYTVSFDYFLEEYEMTGEYIAVQPRLNYNEVTMDSLVNVKLGKWYTYTDTITTTNRANEIYFFMWPSVKIYIDNIVIKDADGKVVSTAKITKNTIVEDKGGVGKGKFKLEKNIPVEDKTVYAFEITTDKNSEEGQQNMWFMTTYPEKGAKVVFEMDYYVVGGDESARVCNIADGSNLADDTTGYADLDFGVNHYKGTFTGVGQMPDGNTKGLHFGLSIKTEDDVVVYVWNIKVTIDGVEQEILSNDEILETGTLNKKLIKYSDIDIQPVPEPDPNHPANIDYNPGGKLMLKQENYKNREEYGLLTYQSFVQYVGADRNGSVIKENTTYVFSFDYYADPGAFGQGVNSTNAVWKSLHTGYNDEITKPNQHLIWNEDKQARSGYNLPNSGRHHIEIEYTTLPGQTDFMVGLESGWDGDAYFWNFQLVEKDGDGTNLLFHTDFEGPFAKMCTEANDSGSKRKTYWRVSDQSADAMGTYSFVPFNEEMAALGEGEVLQSEEVLPTPKPQPQPQPETADDAVVEDNSSSNNMPIIIVIIAAIVLGIGAVTFILVKSKKKKVS